MAKLLNIMSMLGIKKILDNSCLWNWFLSTLLNLNLCSRLLLLCLSCKKNHEHALVLRFYIYWSWQGWPRWSSFKSVRLYFFRSLRCNCITNMFILLHYSFSLKLCNINFFRISLDWFWRRLEKKNAYLNIFQFNPIGIQIEGDDICPRPIEEKIQIWN